MMKYTQNLYLIKSDSMHLINFMLSFRIMSEASNNVKIDTKELFDQTGNTNVKQVICQRCPSKIIPPKFATLSEEEFKLAPMKKKTDESGNDGGEECLTQFYCVKDMFDFDNVGFTKDVGEFKFLCCADCEIGPIGYHKKSDGTSYVALARIRHQE